MTPASLHATHAVVMGASAGGLTALSTILHDLPTNFRPAVIIVQHITPQADDWLSPRLQSTCRLPVSTAEDKQPIRPSAVYVAPPDFHLMVEPEIRFSLSREERVHFSRPSIDVLFETAADAFGKNLVGVILTGASADGAAGMREIQRRGGKTVVQDPKTAEVNVMPTAALAACQADAVLPLAAIGPYLSDFSSGLMQTCKPIS